MLVAALVSSLLWAAVVGGPAAPAAAPEPFRLQIVHLNDFHARFEPVSKSAGSCKEGDTCQGGLARVARALLDERNRNPEALLLNAGDNFQGTLWYTLFRWNVTAHFMSRLPWDAMTIGNHEFDHGIDGLVPFLEVMIKVCPVVIANMDDAEEERMHGLHTPSTIVEKGGKRIGIVGYILRDTPTIANTEKLTFSDELEALDAEAARLKQQGVQIIVALSHSGLDVDLEVAKKTKHADVIVGSHSHTLLYNGKPPSGDKAAGPYPTVVQQDSGRTVLVVQAAAYTKYLGNITVDFDEEGEVTAWLGQPIWMSPDLPQDEATLREMEPWQREVQATGQRVLGSSRVELDKKSCYSGECTLGNFVADAFVDHYVGRGPEGSWTAAAIGCINAGGLRTNIAPGDVTYNDMAMAQPFENTVDLVELQGRHLVQVLEDSVDEHSLLHWSGIRVEFDYSKPAQQRIVSAEVLCANCSVPRYGPIDPDEWYTLAAASFLVESGDNFLSLSQNYRNRRIGPTDMDVFTAYLASYSPVLTEEDGRLNVLNNEGLKALVARRQMHHQDIIFA